MPSPKDVPDGPVEEAGVAAGGVPASPRVVVADHAAQDIAAALVRRTRRAPGEEARRRGIRLPDQFAIVQHQEGHRRRGHEGMEVVPLHLQGVFRLFALGDVGQKVQRGFFPFPNDGHHVQIGPADPAAAVQEPKGVPGGGSGPLLSLPVTILHEGPVLRVEKFHERPGDQVFPGVSGDLAGALVDELEHALLGDKDGLRGVLHEEAVRFLALPEGRFRLYLLRDIGKDAHSSMETALRVQHGGDGQAHVDHDPVLFPALGPLDRRMLLLPDRCPDVLEFALLVLRHRRDRMPEDLLRAPSEHPLCRRVPQMDEVVFIDGDDGQRRRHDRGLEPSPCFPQGLFHVPALGDFPLHMGHGGVGALQPGGHVVARPGQVRQLVVSLRFDAVRQVAFPDHGGPLAERRQAFRHHGVERQGLGEEGRAADRRKENDQEGSPVPGPCPCPVGGREEPADPVGQGVGLQKDLSEESRLRLGEAESLSRGGSALPLLLQDRRKQGDGRLQILPGFLEQGLVLRPDKLSGRGFQQAPEAL